MEENPFPDLKVSESGWLDEIPGRSACPRCNKSRKWYCYTCNVPIAALVDKIPRVKLPLKLDIIKHPSECDGKSTSAHAGVLAPDDVTIYTYPTIPEFSPHEKVVLVFPGAGSVSLEELARQASATASPTPSIPTTTRQPEVEPTNAELSADSAKTKKESDYDSEKSCQALVAPRDGSDTVSSESRAADDDRDVSEKGAKEQGTRQEDGANDEEPGPTDLREQTDSEGPARKKLLIEEGAKKPDTPEGAANPDTPEPEAASRLTLPFDRVVFIDSTWSQTHRICIDERLKGLQRVEIKTQKTKFWRHQHEKPDTYLATIEAIYYFVVEFHKLFLRSEYVGEYDNLLFFFCFMYNKIKGLYDGGKYLKAYSKKS